MLSRPALYLSLSVLNNRRKRMNGRERLHGLLYDFSYVCCIPLLRLSGGFWSTASRWLCAQWIARNGLSRRRKQPRPFHSQALWCTRLPQRVLLPYGCQREDPGASARQRRTIAWSTLLSPFSADRDGTAGVLCGARVSSLPHTNGGEAAAW